MVKDSKLNLYDFKARMQDMQIGRWITLNTASGNSRETNRYRLTTKEIQDEQGLNWYDFGARMQDMQIGRWLGVDEEAESQYGKSSYTYCNDNSILLLDPDGR